MSNFCSKIAVDGLPTGSGTRGLFRVFDEGRAVRVLPVRGQYALSNNLPLGKVWASLSRGILIRRESIDFLRRWKAVTRWLIAIFVLGNSLSCLNAAMIFPGDLEDDIPTIVYDQSSGDLYVDVAPTLDTPTVWLGFTMTSEGALFLSREAPSPAIVSGPFSVFTDAKISTGFELTANDLALPSILPLGLSGAELSRDLTFIPGCFLVLCASPDLYVVPEPIPAKRPLWIVLLNLLRPRRNQI